jgi:hypothetical protein
MKLLIFSTTGSAMQRSLYAGPAMTEEVVVVSKSSPVRRRAIEGALGLFGGLVFACLNGPWLLSLLYTPPSGTISCGPPVTDALNYFVKLQLISGLIGGVALLFASFLVRRMWRKRREARTAPGT